MTFGPYTVKMHPKFKGVIVNAKFTDFMKSGFDYGDSVDIDFSNGKKLKDVPFYNGFYTKTHMPVICFHPGYELIYVCYNDGPEMYLALNLKESDTATFTLNTKGKYLDIQNSMNQDYSYNRDDYESDEIFANFRPLNYGNIKPNLIYRSSSPIKNSENRAKYVNDLSREVGIDYIIDLSIDSSELTDLYNNKEMDNAFWDDLYINNHILPINLSTLLESPTFKSSIAKSLNTISENNGPFLINCSLGKDRTGFICIVIETLGGASLEEIEDDFMKSFENLHFIKKNTVKYDVIKDIKFSNYAGLLAHENNISNITQEKLFKGTIEYLLSSGMSKEEIEKFISKITTK